MDLWTTVNKSVNILLSVRRGFYFQMKVCVDKPNSSCISDVYAIEDFSLSQLCHSFKP